MTESPRAHRLLIVHTGDGKGKSTAAFGTALRAWSHGLSVGVFQFVKSGRWPTGERTAFETLAASGRGPTVEWQAFGAGFTWVRPGDDHADLARQGWAHVRERLDAGTFGLLVLDEFTYPLANGWLDLDEVLAALRGRRGFQHVIVTGRRAPQPLLDAADLVTDFASVKHPLTSGIKAQPGIEW